MAALHGHGVDNATIDINGDELPIMDGSAAAFSVLLKSAGLREQSEPRRFLQVVRPIKVAEGDKWAALLPGDHFSVTYEIAYQHQAIRNQRFDLVVTPQSFDDELAPARTFGFLADLDAMRQAGLANGGSLDNAIVVGNFSVLNAGGLRYPDEFVRHKAMDAVGDLYLTGYPILGRFHAYKSGHGMNHKLVTKLLADKSAWRLVEGRPEAMPAGEPMAAYAT
jgi:UDP-3-O-[3-hydroxymyristoyl] N-acetylglucosamine deacetylase